MSPEAYQQCIISFVVMLAKDPIVPDRTINMDTFNQIDDDLMQETVDRIMDECNFIPYYDEYVNEE